MYCATTSAEILHDSMISVFITNSKVQQSRKMAYDMLTPTHSDLLVLLVHQHFGDFQESKSQTKILCKYFAVNLKFKNCKSHLDTKY